MRQEELKAIGIKALSPMQQTAYEKIRAGKSIILLSPTGTGKTLAFLLPMTEGLLTDRPLLQAIVITPSRELTLQSYQFFSKLKTGLQALAIYGGHPILQDRQKLNNIKPQIVFATPGRLLDHLQQNSIEVDATTLLVIDEYDKCLELGFEETLRQINLKLPFIEQYVFTSATATTIPDVFFHRTPPTLSVLNFNDQNETRKTLNVVQAENEDKARTLALLLSQTGGKKSLVFVSHREEAESVAHYLKAKEFFAEVYHGGLMQQDRERAIYKFRSNCSNILVATDLAARGLDIPDIHFIIHYDLPNDETTYIHRNGRTERWDATGESFAIINAQEDLPAFCSSTTTYVLNAKQISAPSPEYAALYIGRGKKDKISRGDVVGFLCKQGHLAPSDIGLIEVAAKHTYAAIEKSKIARTLENIKDQKLKGMKTLIELMKK